MHWKPEDLDRLERALTERSRVRVMRRGTEYVVLPKALETEGPVEILVAVHATTGDDLRFRLDEINDFDVLG